MKRKIQNIFLFLLIFMQCSCNRTIYVYHNPKFNSVEEFELKGNKLFLYKHENNSAKLETKGEYDISGKTILFKFNPLNNNIDLLPTNKLEFEIEKLSSFDGTKINFLIIVDSNFEEGLICANVDAFSGGKLIFSGLTDFDGQISFQTEKMIDLIRISHEKSSSVEFKLLEKGEFQIMVRAELKYGKYYNGCSIPDTGAEIEMSIIFENEEIVGIKSNDNSNRTYILKEKKK